MKLKEIADLIGAEISGDPDVEITGASGIMAAGRGDITFVSEKKYTRHIEGSSASAIILRKELKGLAPNTLIVDNPEYSYAKVAEILYVKPLQAMGVSDKASIGTGTSFGNDVTVYPLAYIGENVSIGSRSSVFPGAYIAEGVKVGDDCVIHPNVSIYSDVKIGSRVTIHSGSVIGSDGFGFIKEKGKHHKIPQVGGVIIENDVEIGANVTIDRAAMNKTYTTIGSGTKIDNLVQVAHNVKIGNNCLIIAHVGISGSTEIGDDVILAGQVGVTNHIKVGRGAIIGAQSGVTRDIPDGQVYTGSPAIPHRTWLRAQNIITKLPEYIKRLTAIERIINKEGPSDDG